MIPLNKIPFEIYGFAARITYAKVSYKNLYSSPKYARNTVYIKATIDRIFILNKSYELIMEHTRLYGRGKESMK